MSLSALLVNSLRALSSQFRLLLGMFEKSYLEGSGGGHHPEAGQAEDVWSDCRWQDLLVIYFIGKQTRLFCSSSGWDTWWLFYFTCVCECVVQGIYVCVSVDVCRWVSMWVSPWSQRSVLGLLQSISTLIFEMCSLTLLAVIYPARPDRLVCAWGYVSASSFSRVLLIFSG